MIKPLSFFPLVIMAIGCAGSGTETGNPFDEGAGGSIGALPSCGPESFDGADGLDAALEGFDFVPRDLIDLIGSRSSPLAWSPSPVDAAGGPITLSPQGSTELIWSVEATGAGRVFRDSPDSPGDCSNHVDVDVTLLLDTEDGGFADLRVPAILSSEDGQVAMISAYFAPFEVTGSFSVEPPPGASVQLMGLEIDVEPTADAGRLWSFVEPADPASSDAVEVTFASW